MELLTTMIKTGSGDGAEVKVGFRGSESVMPLLLFGIKLRIERKDKKMYSTACTANKNIICIFNLKYYLLSFLFKHKIKAL